MYQTHKANSTRNELHTLIWRQILSKRVLEDSSHFICLDGRLPYTKIYYYIYKTTVYISFKISKYFPRISLSVHCIEYCKYKLIINFISDELF
jgi:hypothetical protein